MHSARLDKSDRLQNVLALLADGKWYSTRAIIQIADVCAVNSIASELRDNGLQVECRAVRGFRGRYEYRIPGGYTQPYPAPEGSRSTVFQTELAI